MTTTVNKPTQTAEEHNPTPTAEERTTAILEAALRALAAMPANDDDLYRQLTAQQHRREVLSVCGAELRGHTHNLKQTEATLVTETEWKDRLVKYRRIISDELRAIDLPIRDAKVLGRQQNLEFSLITVDRGRVNSDPYAFEVLRVAQLMREDGYLAAPTVENQGMGKMPWYGAIPEVERRIEALTRERKDLQVRIENAERMIEAELAKV